ncbi:hypothetical protein KCU90_g1492, partial [Aureobasidium melanogenum]
MRRRVDLLKRPDRHMRIDLRRLQIRMTEHRLHEPHIGPVLQHQRRHRVPEQMTRTAFLKPRLPDVAVHQPPQRVDMNRFALDRQIQRPVIVSHHELRTCLV